MFTAVAGLEYTSSVTSVNLSQKLADAGSVDPAKSAVFISLRWEMPVKKEMNSAFFHTSRCVFLHRFVP